MAKVSIVSSVYNKGPWLERCLSSIMNQTFRDMEIILVNNGSTDNSLDIIKKFMEKDKRIRLVDIERNEGPAAGIAAGIDSVTADYFGLCDADDYIDSNYVETLYNEIVLERADIVMCPNDYVYSDGTVRKNAGPGRRKILLGKQDIGKLLPQVIDHESDKYLGYQLPEVGAEWAKLYRTSFARDFGINYEKEVWLWCDWLFNFRLIKHINKLVYVEGTLYHNYMSSDSVTRPSFINKNRIKEIGYALRRFNEECETVTDGSKMLDEAKIVFFVRNLASLICYHERFYKNGLSREEFLLYLKEIRNLEISKEALRYIKDTPMPYSNMGRLYLLRGRIYFVEILIAEIKRLKERRK